MLKLMYLVIPFVLDAIITFILSRMKVEEANDKIRAEMKTDIHYSPSQNTSRVRFAREAFFVISNF